MIEPPKKGKDGKYTVNDLLKIVELLRSPGGCPWDRAQTHYSMEKPMIEEAYEVVDAIDKNDRDKMVEELGDVLLQVLFHSVIGQEDGEFDLDDVATRCTEKMIERHRHIFGDVKADCPEEALATWEQAKQKEKGFSTLKEDLDDIPKCFPALLRAQKAAKKIERAGETTGVREFDLGGVDFGDEKEVGELLYEICRRATEKGTECELALKRKTDAVIEEKQGK
ncbi:MAG: MazG family protein [Clostridia bacterium]|nr:MazG family protein [Clostridia bacterium]